MAPRRQISVPERKPQRENRRENRRENNKSAGSFQRSSFRPAWAKSKILGASIRGVSAVEAGIEVLHYIYVNRQLRMLLDAIEVNRIIESGRRDIIGREIRVLFGNSRSARHRRLRGERGNGSENTKTNDRKKKKHPGELHASPPSSSFILPLPPARDSCLRRDTEGGRDHSKIPRNSGVTRHSRELSSPILSPTLATQPKLPPPETLS